MQKRIIRAEQPGVAARDAEWLDLKELADVEISSEDAAHPIEAAFAADRAAGWRAAEPGAQVLRLLFHEPQRLRHIRVGFEESRAERTQEYVLRWSADGGQSFREIVRQQWNFSPHGATAQIEDHEVDLPAVTVLEMKVVPDVGGGPAVATLAEWRLA